MIDQIIQDLAEKRWSFQRGVLSALQLDQMAHLFESDFEPARVGRQGELQRLEAIRGDWIRWIDPLTPPSVLQAPLQLLDQLMFQANRKLFLGLKQYECHLAKYPAGTFYRKHLDRHAEASSRVLTYIFYLHQDWKNDEGGELVIYNDKNELIQKLTPESGSLVTFISEDFPHEVLPAKRERRSLTGWMHSKLIY
jgi:SM-20-related protein